MIPTVPGADTIAIGGEKFYPSVPRRRSSPLLVSQRESSTFKGGPFSLGSSIPTHTSSRLVSWKQGCASIYRGYRGRRCSHGLLVRCVRVAQESGSSVAAGMRARAGSSFFESEGSRSHRPG